MNNDTQRLDYFEQHNRDFRFCGHPTMDGKYPAWSYWSPDKGRNESTIKKTLREAIDAAMDEGGILSPNVEGGRPKSESHFAAGFQHAENLVRAALRGHSDSELWGENGLLAATMRCVDAVQETNPDTEY